MPNFMAGFLCCVPFEISARTARQEWGDVKSRPIGGGLGTYVFGIRLAVPKAPRYSGVRYISGVMKSADGPGLVTTCEAGPVAFPRGPTRVVAKLDAVCEM